MIKCIASDMDGTLLNSVQQISEENKQAIIKAQAQGVEFVVATGRSYQEATYVLAEAGVSCPVICVNGAEVRSKDGDVISATPISKQLTREVAAKLTEVDVYFEVYTNKGAFTVDADKAVSTLVDIIVSANPEVKREEIIYAAGARLRDGLVHTVEDYEILFSDEEYQIYKLLVFSFDADKLAAAGKLLTAFNELAVAASGRENLEVTNKKAQKGLALEAFAHAKGISLAETMAIGDNYNDVSMFEKAGRSVAMGNANYEIKSLCDVITDTNEENGVAKAILEVL
ncbi:Cof-type HAD-IIB family hydrolase [Neobacillus vireti]|uniref:Cof-like hydrolase n=1 Tax=Neobacillus vireti LMG 21834 TaxID=1131730 RepID=A0AB94IKU2_9BACI|nr:Cof-type HAD-IIB family hydrolase [Neobacillus vireti]ETI67665.1 Cof-like hydrolase [Neobacillus vireti LMG 21834]KLT16705.1 hydrolase [Neobacillus vireti]